uniref:Uncharacterized protein n=1 Tax=Anas zonorhyncha TaxID=75864 RepID=A0A8B9ZW25_9AVES
MEGRGSSRAPPHLFTDGAHTPQVAPAGVGAGPYPYACHPPVPLHRPDLSLPLQLDAPSLLTQPPLVLAATTAGGPSLLPSAIGSTTAPDQAPSTSAFTALRVRIAPAPAERSSRSPAVPQARDGAVLGRCGAGGLGLALFGTELGDNALFQSLVEENGCCLLYVVEDRLHEVERAFSAEFLAGTRVLRQQDADIVLNDQRYQTLLT